MSLDVVYQMPLCDELLRTEFAFEVPLTIVTSQMYLQVAIFSEAFIAIVTFEGFYSLMFPNVYF
jgi:hypothetical protein